MSPEKIRQIQLRDEAQRAAFKKYNVPDGALITGPAAAKIDAGEMTYDEYFAGLDWSKKGTILSSTGGPGGSFSMTTAPGTVGGAMASGSSGGGSSGGGYSAGGGTSGRDPMAEAALKRIEQVGTGANVPMNAAQTDRMMSSQSDMTAGAEAQQQAALRRTVGAGGGSLYDPSTGAAEREITADRQAANQGARREIDTNAQAQNFEAQFAANRLLAAQADGGINSGNPYGQNGRYGTGDQAQYSSTDPRRGGNIQSYSGYNLDPNQMNNTATQQAAQAALARNAPGNAIVGYTKTGGYR